MTTRPARSLSALAAAVAAVALVLPAAPVLAAVVPVDPGPIAAGRPIVGTTVNLPPLPLTPPTVPYNAGEQFAAAITAYYATGQAAIDQAGVARAARAWTRSWLDSACGGIKPARVRACRAMAVFDVDETLLDNQAYYASQTPAYTFNPVTFTDFQNQCLSPAIAASAALLRHFRSLGMGVALITGRNESARAVTEACLRQRGIDGWTTLVMRDASTSGLTAAEYKARARQQLQAQGWRIGPSIGDQVSDMAGGFLRKGFLLPDPMYFIP